ncbi:hypothetical protein E4U30_007988 [Claviceps sp. LM220 group G6]|nr:hypothetical protein E4U30_007988 [Claviceps sp. LM220 group G6]
MGHSHFARTESPLAVPHYLISPAISRLRQSHLVSPTPTQLTRSALYLFRRTPGSDAPQDFRHANRSYGPTGYGGREQPFHLCLLERSSLPRTKDMTGAIRRRARRSTSHELEQWPK